MVSPALGLLEGDASTTGWPVGRCDVGGLVGLGDGMCVVGDTNGVPVVGCAVGTICTQPCPSTHWQNLLKFSHVASVGRSHSVVGDAVDIDGGNGSVGAPTGGLDGALLKAVGCDVGGTTTQPGSISGSAGVEHSASLHPTSHCAHEPSSGLTRPWSEHGAALSRAKPRSVTVYARTRAASAWFAGSEGDE